jgi:hypothetical protein
MEMSAQPHDPVASPRRDTRRYPLDMRVSGLQRRKNLLPLPGIQPRSLGRPDHSSSLY